MIIFLSLTSRMLCAETTLWSTKHVVFCRHSWTLALLPWLLQLASFNKIFFHYSRNGPYHHNHHSYYRKSYYGGPRRYGPGWSNGPVAPRFERKAAAEGRGYYGGHGHDHESEEHLPNGFTKIRSKNLDVLFRKDYYAQR